MDNITVGSVHYDEGPVGCTYIDFKNNARVYEDLRGGAVNRVSCIQYNSVSEIGGICFAGGSTLGLEATTGCIVEKMKQLDYYSWKGINGAIIWSRCFVQGNTCNPLNYIYADKNLGKFAVRNTKKNIVLNGQVGVGTMANHGQ